MAVLFAICVSLKQRPLSKLRHSAKTPKTDPKIAGVAAFDHSLFLGCVPFSAVSPFAEGGPQHLSGAIVVSVDSLTWVAMASAALRPSTIATKYFTLLSAPDTCLMHPALKFEL
jgi:hypothetical protein